MRSSSDNERSSPPGPVCDEDWYAAERGDSERRRDPLGAYIGSIESITSELAVSNSGGGGQMKVAGDGNELKRDRGRA